MSRILTIPVNKVSVARSVCTFFGQLICGAGNFLFFKVDTDGRADRSVDKRGVWRGVFSLDISCEFIFVCKTAYFFRLSEAAFSYAFLWGIHVQSSSKVWQVLHTKMNSQENKSKSERSEFTMQPPTELRRLSKSHVFMAVVAHSQFRCVIPSLWEIILGTLKEIITNPLLVLNFGSKDYLPESNNNATKLLDHLYGRRRKWAVHSLTLLHFSSKGFCIPGLLVISCTSLPVFPLEKPIKNSRIGLPNQKKFSTNRLLNFLLGFSWTI
jgi:hypothetical protein